MIVVLLTITLFVASIITNSAGKNYLKHPIQIYAPLEPYGTKSIELHVTNHTATVNNSNSTPIAEITIRAYSYQGTTSFIGPTIHAKPGDTINVTLVNDLIGVGRLDNILYNFYSSNTTTEAYKDPDVTNLHTHGLHVDPRIDDVTKWVLPQCPDELTTPNGSKINIQPYWNKLNCYNKSNPIEKWKKSSHNYPYYIPSDHYPGTHWYHAHWHGSVTFDVIQGLYGLFIVDDDKPAYKPNMTEVQLLMGYAWLHDKNDCKNLTNITTTKKVHCHGGEGNTNLQYTRPNQTSTTYPFQFPITSACFITCKMLTQEVKLPINNTNYSQLQFSGIDVYPVSTFIDTQQKGIQLFFVNGQVHPTKQLNAGEWYHFRMVNTVMNYLLFWLKNETRIKPNCNFLVMGQDGIYFEKGPRDLYSSPYIDRKVVLPPGSRADLAVNCRCPQELVVDGFCTYEIYAAAKFIKEGVNIKGVNIDGFAPVPEKEELLLYIEVPAPTTTYTYQNATEAAAIFNWTPQPYMYTPYLNDTQNAETDAFCAETDFKGKVNFNGKERVEYMTQCNIVHGRGSYPSGAGPKSQVAMNQVQFSHEYQLSKVCVGDPDQETFPTHEWSVTSNFHPFHHHTFPFQLQRNVTLGFIAMKGDWRDTVGAAGTFRMRSNYQTNDFGLVDGKKFQESKLIMHCHYVPHEDHGMMQQVGILADC
eukprot:191010_1